MTAHLRKLKNAVLEIDGTEYQVQVTNVGINNNTDDPEVVYVLVEGEEVAEEATPSYSLPATFLSDWRENGISDYLWAHDGEQVPFQLDIHPERPGEHVRWVGQLAIKAPSFGGEANATDTMEVEFQCVGKPVYSRP